MLNVVLYEPEIPQNTGNIMRTCVATNAMLHLIEPLGFKLDEKSLKRAGVNYIDKLKYKVYKNDLIMVMTDRKATMELLGKTGKIFEDKEFLLNQKPHSSFDYHDPKENIYFIFGKESTGISKKILKPNIDHCLRIHMTDNVRALNLANTVAIVLYEALRQQNYPNLFWDEPHKSKTEIEDYQEE